jgi:hypothetical protein
MDGRALMLLEGCKSDLIYRELSVQEDAPQQSPTIEVPLVKQTGTRKTKAVTGIVVIKKPQADALLKNLRGSWKVINFVFTFA